MAMLLPQRSTRRQCLAQGALAALALAGSARRLEAKLAAWPSECTAGRFRLHADFSLAPYAALVEELKQLEDDLEDSLHLTGAEEEIHLLLFEKKETYQAYLAQYFPKVPARQALFIKGRGPGMVFAYRSADLAVDVRHESTHALLHTAVTDIPLWLDEGLAEYFEAPPRERAAKHPYAGAVRWNVRLGYVPSLAKLEKLTKLEEMGAREYRDAWAWVHYLLHASDDTRVVLQDYMQWLARQRDVEPLSAHLARRVEAPDEALARHFRRERV